MIEETINSVALEYRPPLRVRFWRALGFRHHHGETPDGADDLPGWMLTNVRLRFSFLDRLRLVLTGDLKIKVVQHTPEQVSYSMNRIDWEIVPPGDTQGE